MLCDEGGHMDPGDEAAWEALTRSGAGASEDMPAEELAAALRVLQDAWACWRDTLLP